MATLQQIIDAQAAEKAAIDALAARIAAKPAGITEADLDPILANSEAHTAELNNIAP